MREDRKSPHRSRRGGWHRIGNLPRVLASCIVALASGAPGAAAGVPDPAIPRSEPGRTRPAAAIPLLPASFPAGVRIDFGAGSPLRDRPAWPVSWRETGPPAPDRSSRITRQPWTSRFSDRLMARMESEARRYRDERLFDVSGGRFPADSVAEEQRASEAGRIFKRALDRTLDDRLEQLARTSLGLGGFLEWLDDFGGPRLESGPARTARSRLLLPAQPAAEGSSSRRAPAFHADLGLRLGAHPRLVLKTEFLGIRGRLEVPVLEEALRLTFERPLGPRSRAALSGGLSRDGDDWVAVTINAGF